MSIRLDTLPALARQIGGRTDGWICRNNIALFMHYMLTRDKNSLIQQHYTCVEPKVTRLVLYFLHNLRQSVILIRATLCIVFAVVRCPSVRLSVRHTPVLRTNGYIYFNFF